ncbi:phosphoglycerate mutase-like protein [Tilletiaria anomala UBC 951]|uniref:Phosphoglycerate mutase-like protein n=1 Tax=Tilletiaria anomala (strain ATCC 24038 / CBS 436.72 / UBC 951) TaxID=1037660 RepID=A0A066VKN4_TILAU|nr:phosphoglycerate mutase-like protein [Tilletiaria anomala UBC 951]KDN39314.1 phosphoglycerate mutase-like protein [Tilletiaria anomala UBC 951]
MLFKLSSALLLASSLAVATPTPSTPFAEDVYLEDPHVLFSRQAGAVRPNATIDISPAFPTDIGYSGTIKYGAAPFLAQNNRLNSTKPNLGAATKADEYTPANSKGSDFNMARYWGNTSPWFPSPLFSEAQKNRQLDPTCKITNVHILHRHGARYPTSYSTEGAPYFGVLATNASTAAATGGAAFTNTGPLAFLSNYTYQLGAEILTPVGAQQVFDSGIKAYYSYGSLYNSTAGGNGTAPRKPVIRTTSQERMLDSARYWTAGFFGLDAPSLIDLLVILEGDGFNNTLASYDTCNNSNVGALAVGDTYLTPQWEATYLKGTVERLQQYTSLNLTTEMVYGMQSLCAYETNALGYSPFCELFTEDEWRGFEYFLDLQFQGDYGSMSPSGRAQGIGYVQEFLARLTNGTIPADQITTQNSTLLTPEYFPTDQPMYVDFTHDDIILSVLVALNYTHVVGEYLSATTMDDNRTFVLSHITPFAARLIFEVAECGSTEGGNSTQIIRTILNDALIPMNEAQGCTPRSDGSCLLSEFVQFQQATAYKAANFDFACFGNYTLTGPTVTNGTIA